MLMDYSSLLAGLIPIVTAASNEIIEVYNGEYQVRNKADDSPVTDADLRANVAILDGLAKLSPHIPVVSEESSQASYKDRVNWSRYWLVDPLDGTREFIKRNDEFTVNIALVENHSVTLGVVGLPVQKVIYAGIVPDRKAVKMTADTLVDIEVRRFIPDCARLLTSRSHIGEALNTAISQFADTCPSVELKAVGSSLKLCLLAEGQADIYPKLGPTSEWDTAAGQAVLEAAGGALWTRDGKTLRYNTGPSLLNPDFIAVSDSQYAWKLRAPVFFE